MALLFILQDKIKKEYVHFGFRNENGNIEFAYGTRNKELIPEDKRRRPRMKEKFKEQSNDHLCSSCSQYQPYFDFNKNCWNQFDVDKLLWVQGEGVDRIANEDEFYKCLTYSDSLKNG